MAITMRQWEALRDLVGLAEAGGWAYKGEIKQAHVALREVRPGAPSLRPVDAQYLDDRITALTARVFDVEQDRHIAAVVKDIRRDRLSAYRLGVVSDMSTDSLLAELKRRAGD